MKKLITRLAQAALAIGTTLAVLSPAHAALISTEWDPSFGPPLSTIGWKGSMTYDTVSRKAANLNVSFYDVASPTVEIKVNVPLFEAPALTNFFVDSNFTGPKVTSYASTRTAWQDAKTKELKDWVFSIQFDIYDGRTYARLFTKSNLEAADSSEKESSFRALVYCSTTVAGNDACGVGTTGGTMFVPEPGSLTLVLAALVGAGWTARRRLGSVPSPAIA